jgi:hypothetical protein
MVKLLGLRNPGWSSAHDGVAVSNMSNPRWCWCGKMMRASCIKYERLVEMVIGRKKKFYLTFILPFYGDQVFGSHATGHVTIGVARWGQTRLTRGGVLNITSKNSFVLSSLFCFVVWFMFYLHNHVAHVVRDFI